MKKNFVFEKLSALEMSKLSSQEMAVAFGGYLYQVNVTAYDDAGYKLTMGFNFDSQYTYSSQYQLAHEVVQQKLSDWIHYTVIA